MKRLPIIRHIRYWLERRSMERHYDKWIAEGFCPAADYDKYVLEMIWRGEA